MIVGIAIIANYANRPASRVGWTIFLGSLAILLGWGVIGWATVEHTTVLTLVGRGLIRLAIIVAAASACVGAAWVAIRLLKALRGTALGDLAAALKEDLCPIAYARN